MAVTRAEKETQLEGLTAAFAVFGLYWGAWAACLPAIQRSTGASEAQLGLARSAVWSVAGEAVVEQDRADVSVVFEMRLCGAGHAGDQQNQEDAARWAAKKLSLQKRTAMT